MVVTMIHLLWVPGKSAPLAGHRTTANSMHRHAVHAAPLPGRILSAPTEAALTSCPSCSVRLAAHMLSLQAAAEYASDYISLSAGGAVQLSGSAVQRNAHPGLYCVLCLQIMGVMRSSGEQALRCIGVPKHRCMR